MPEASICGRAAKVAFDTDWQAILRFSPMGVGGLLYGPFRACLTCGHVWTHLQPEELRKFIDKHCNAETKLKLSPFRKAPPEQDLV